MRLVDGKLYNEREVLDLIASGDEQAFGRLFNLHRNKIYTIAFKLTHSAIEAQEIVQEVFLKIWVNRLNLATVENFEAYLFVVTQNTSFTALKNLARARIKKNLANATGPEPVNDADRKVMEKEYGWLLENAIARLPAQQERVYRLMKEEGLKRSQVAELLHLSPETIKFHLSEALKNLRAFYRNHFNFFLVLIASFPFFPKK